MVCEMLSISSRPNVLNTPDSKVHVANMGPTWVLSAPDGPHVGPMNLAIRDNTGLANLGYNWFTCWSGSCFGQAVSSPHSFDSEPLGWCLAWWRICSCYVSMKTRSLPLPPPTMLCWLWCTLLKEQLWFHLKWKRSEYYVVPYLRKLIWKWAPVASLCYKHNLKFNIVTSHDRQPIEIPDTFPYPPPHVHKIMWFMWFELHFGTDCWCLPGLCQGALSLWCTASAWWRLEETQQET